MIVSAPASSANLGPGFDCLALALGGLPFLASDRTQLEVGWHEAERTHPARAAFVAAGGDPESPLWWSSRIPPGRGLGYSGAARVAGAFLAARRAGLGHGTAREVAASVATQLEGHPDNAAASARGGFCVSAAGHTVRLDPPAGVEVLVWSPSASTSTDASRRRLPETVTLADAAFSGARAALWVAAVATGDLSVLRTACEDRLHQSVRLANRADSAAALGTLLGEPEVLAAWLSGSGPTVAALVHAGCAGSDMVTARLGATGRVLWLEPDRAGVTET
jgi:homoserine kinase